MRSITKIVDGFKLNWTRELSEDAIAQAARDKENRYRIRLLRKDAGWKPSE